MTMLILGMVLDDSNFPLPLGFAAGALEMAEALACNAFELLLVGTRSEGFRDEVL